MKLVKLKLRNFRGYKNETIINIDSITALIGKNDAGKSTILEALEIFFNNKVVVCEKEDLSINADDNSIYISCIFNSLPDNVTIDASSVTDIGSENLLNDDGELEILKSFKCTSAKPKPITKIICNHPGDEGYSDLLQLKQADLKKRAKELNVPSEDYDARSNVSIRRAILKYYRGEYKLSEIEVDKEDVKKIYSSLEQFLPVYALFQSDRNSSDSDKEVTDPMSIAVSQALSDLQSEIEKIKSEVKKKAIETAERTLLKLKEMDEELANSLIPEFKSEPKFDSLFKLSINSDNNISINKRGSGVRRLILLNFFRSEAERKLIENEKNKSIIYAFEEPETSQHPSHQKMLIDSFLKLSNRDNTQVLLTTHTPALGGMLPVSSLRFIDKQNGITTVCRGEGETLEKIVAALGVLPEPISPLTKAIILVEGKTDVIFLTHLCRRLKESGEIEKTFEEAGITILPTGGCDNLKTWVTTRTINKFGLPFGIFLDSDRLNSGMTTKNTEIVKTNKAKGILAFSTLKREAENYLHKDVFDVDVNIEDYNDVKKEVVDKLTEKLKEELGDSYNGKDKAIKESKILGKYWYRMTFEQIREREKYTTNNGESHFELTEIIVNFLSLVNN